MNGGDFFIQTFKPGFYVLILLLLGAPQIPLLWRKLGLSPGFLRLWHCKSDPLTHRVDRVL
jgi:hypothetical protein